MITMAKRIEELRTERNLSRPGLSAALGLPRLAIEKFETGRQTPTQEQQNKIAEYFGVSLFYLRGESNDRTRMEQWIEGNFDPNEVGAPQPVSPKRPQKPQQTEGQGNLFDSFLDSPKFQAALRAVVIETLRSPEGQEILKRMVDREIGRQS